MWWARGECSNACAAGKSAIKCQVALRLSMLSNKLCEQTNLDKIISNDLIDLIFEKWEGVSVPFSVKLCVGPSKVTFTLIDLNIKNILFQKSWNFSASNFSIFGVKFFNFSAATTALILTANIKVQSTHQELRAEVPITCITTPHNIDQHVSCQRW